MKQILKHVGMLTLYKLLYIYILYIYMLFI
jgi:hypothetical protein